MINCITFKQISYFIFNDTLDFNLLKILSRANFYFFIYQFILITFFYYFKEKQNTIGNI